MKRAESILLQEHTKKDSEFRVLKFCLFLLSVVDDFC